ncbi:MAG TPA: hypothetical protein VFJ84_03290 [Candidatus Saccharimonadales bacterium]|nr:hypothetical protein [Candidatus Saccharimonadales bacterium]
MNEARTGSEIPNPLIIENLPGDMGFIESASLQSRRPRILEAMRSGDWNLIGRLLKDYRAHAEELIKPLQGDDFHRAKIGLVAAIGLMWREAGAVVSYGNELWNARNYARNMHYDDAEAVLDFAYSKVERFVEESEAAQPYVGPPTPELIALCKTELPVSMHEELDLLLPLPPEEALEQIASLMYGADDYGAESEEPYDFFERMGWISPQTQARGQ